MNNTQTLPATSQAPQAPTVNLDEKESERLNALAAHFDSPQDPPAASPSSLPPQQIQQTQPTPMPQPPLEQTQPPSGGIKSLFNPFAKPQK